jgi:hypothetical protein
MSPQQHRPRKDDTPVDGRPIWPEWKQHPLLTVAGWLSFAASVWIAFWLIVHYLLHLL